MNIAIIAEYNTANQPMALMRAINRYTEHNARCIVIHNDWKKAEMDILLDELDGQYQEVEKILKNADVLHFTGLSSGKIQPIAGFQIEKMINKNNSVITYYGSDIRYHKDTRFRFHLETGIIGVIGWVEPRWEALPMGLFHIPSIFEGANITPSYWTGSEKIVIAHAPTSKKLKGSQFFIEAIEDLKHEFDFEFLLIENVPHKEALELKRKAHIYLEQVNLGTYNVNSIEAMYMGQAVLCYISNFNRSIFPDMPVIGVDKYNIREKLRNLLEHPHLIIDVGKKSREWVCYHHSPRRVAKQWDYLYKYIRHDYGQ